jgi:putative PEP-CTERM system histidine kinase
MVHDLKNIVAQLTFITSNFPKYRDKPEFIDDAVETISHASDKMKKLLGSLGKSQVVSPPNLQKVDLAGLLGTIIARRSLAQPEPVLGKSVPGLIVRVEKDKLASALEHLIQNAQEAADVHGHVWLDLEQLDNQARITITDDGCGMDEEFIKTRLFKPFDTTKGNAGMGIGVYESREIIREIGGSIRVSSRPGVGTEFTIILPCTDGASAQASNQADKQQ